MDYLVDIEGTRFGPYTREQFDNYVANGQIPPHALVWHADQQRWESLAAIPTDPAAPASPSAAHMSAASTPDPPRGETKTNGLAITSLVLAVVSFPLLLILVGILTALVAIIVGIVALLQIKKRAQGPDAQKGNGLAIAGIVVGAVAVASSVVVWAIAIPVFLNQRNSAADASVQADLRNAAMVEETVMVNSGAYTTSLSELQAAGFVPSADSGQVSAYLDGSDGYCLQATSSSGKTFRYVSGDGLTQGTCQ